MPRISLVSTIHVSVFLIHQIKEIHKKWRNGFHYLTFSSTPLVPKLRHLYGYTNLLTPPLLLLQQQTPYPLAPFFLCSLNQQTPLLWIHLNLHRLLQLKSKKLISFILFITSYVYFDLDYFFVLVFVEKFNSRFMY